MGALQPLGDLAPQAKVTAQTRLLIAPQDIRTADATRAEDIYAGYFAFGARIVNTAPARDPGAGPGRLAARMVPS